MTPSLATAQRDNEPGAAAAAGAAASWSTTVTRRVEIRVLDHLAVGSEDCHLDNLTVRPTSPRRGALGSCCCVRIDQDLQLGQQQSLWVGAGIDSTDALPAVRRGFPPNANRQGRDAAVEHTPDNEKG